VNTAYDLGGTAGFGRVVTPDGEASFHADWEKRVLGLVRQLRVLPGEASAAWRTILERMDATTYLTSTYYERFVTVVTERAINQGLVTEQELRERIATMEAGTWAGEPPGAPAGPRAAFDMSGRRQNARHEAGAPPEFAVGNRVCVRNYHPAGHTRLPLRSRPVRDGHPRQRLLPARGFRQGWTWSRTTAGLYGPFHRTGTLGPGCRRSRQRVRRTMAGIPGARNRAAER
jgi:hypothetical protein